MLGQQRLYAYLPLTQNIGAKYNNLMRRKLSTR